MIVPKETYGVRFELNTKQLNIKSCNSIQVFRALEQINVPLIKSGSHYFAIYIYLNICN